jgi:hypothetical protein
MATNEAAYLDPNGVLTVGGVTKTPTLLTSSGGNVPVDASEGPRFEVELTEATTELNNPSNLADGQEFTILIKQDSTGSRALTFGTNWIATDGITTAIDSTADGVTILRGHAADLPNGPGLRIYYTLEHDAESSGSGVAGPGSSTDTAIVRWNGTGGDTVQDSTLTLGATTITQTTADAALNLVTGTASATGTGGSIGITAADGGATSGAGGAVAVTAGSAATSGAGGDLTLTTGTGISAAGGNLTLTPGSGSSQGVVQLVPVTGGTAPELRFLEDQASGANYASLQAAGTMAGDTPYTLPIAYPAANNYLLASSTSGAMSWEVPGTNLGIVSLSSSSNQVAIDASAGSQFKLNGLAENTEIQIPSNGSDGDQLVLSIEQDGTGGRVVTWASGYQNDGQLVEVSTEADRVSIVELTARDFGSGVVWSYRISHAETITGLTDIDASQTTADATVTTIASFATSTDDAVYLIDASFVAIDTTAGHVYERGLRAVVYRNGSSVLSLANVNNYSTYSGDDATWAATVEVSSTNILLRVQGDATNSTYWHVKGVAKEHHA